MSKILLVEDNVIINKTLSRMLKNHGYDVESAFNAEDAMNMFKPDKYDLMILDLQLPKMSGYTFLQVIRKKSDIPVIINTSFATVKSRVKLINVGANDFINKESSQKEILQSIELLLEEQEKEKAKPRKKIKIFDLEIDFKNHTLYKANESVELTAKEFEILRLLFDNPHYAFSRKQLYMLIWGEEYDPSYDNTINVHMKRLRNKIENNAKKPDIIETVWKHGYRLGKNAIDELTNNHTEQAD